MTDNNHNIEILPRDIWLAALEWQIASGADEALDHTPADKTKITALAMPDDMEQQQSQPVSTTHANAVPFSVHPSPAAIKGTSGATEEAVRLAAAASTLEELRSAIATFDGNTLKKTATNMVFGSGNPSATVMFIGEAPGAEEDRRGEAYAGDNGLLLNRMLASIGLSRTSGDPETSAYTTTLLNWRPPGNRSPTKAEIELSLPFAERHIQLAGPKLLVIFGGSCAKALLRKQSSLNSLRQNWHEYTPRTPGLPNQITEPIPAIVTHCPSRLLGSPREKRAAWADLLMLKKHLLARQEQV